MSEIKYDVQEPTSVATAGNTTTLDTLISTPSGKKTIVDLLSFCYSMNETIMQVYLSILKKRMTEEDITNELQISKAAVNRALRLLLVNGLVKRTKETGNKAGRPRYVYYVDNESVTKLFNDLETCIPNMKNVVETLIDSIRKYLEQTNAQTK